MVQLDVEAFARNGYIVAGGLVSDDLLRPAIAELDAAVPVDGSPGMRSTQISRARAPRCFAALLESDLWPALQALSSIDLEVIDQELQHVLNVPPTMNDAAAPHVDFHVPSSERPNSFTFLVALLLSDQPHGDMGNVWVWPGTHLLYGEYLQAYGPTSLLEHGGSITRAAPAVTLPRAQPVCGSVGDVLIAHPLLGHATGPNTSATTRRAIYFRIRRTDHVARWAECVTNPLLEYDLSERCDGVGAPRARERG